MPKPDSNDDQQNTTIEQKNKTKQNKQVTADPI